MAKSKRGQVDFEIYEVDPIAGTFGVRTKIAHGKVTQLGAQGLGVEKFWKPEMSEKEAEILLKEIYIAQKRDEEWENIVKKRRKGA